MKVTAYPYYTPPFSSYNVAQSAVVPFLDKDLNLVVFFATAVGKTVLAECCFAYHLATAHKSRVAYVCPTKSLASEKHSEWAKNLQLGQYGLVLATSDTETSIEDFEESRLSMMTLETFDAKTRTDGYRDWLRSLVCVVFDEAHLLGDESRGGAVESAMMRFSAINPAARIVLLSATMANAKELAQWVKSLNGKGTKCIVSSWRPSRIRIDYEVVEDTEEKVVKAVKLAAESSRMKTVVFVHSKIVGGDIVKRLKSAGVKAAFHNASVSPGRRRKIEQVFNDKMSGLNVLVSTSTLGAGVNVG